MTTKTALVLLGIAALLAAGIGVWYFTLERWAGAYQQTNATWRIQGLCTSAQDGTPVKGAEVIAYFSEPVAFKHHWRDKPPLKTTNVVTNTDEQGRFEVIGVGGHVQIKLRAEGYRAPEPWEDWRHSAVNGVSRVDTNVVLTLQPMTGVSH